MREIDTISLFVILAVAGVMWWVLRQHHLRSQEHNYCGHCGLRMYMREEVHGRRIVEYWACYHADLVLPNEHDSRLVGSRFKPANYDRNTGVKV